MKELEIMKYLIQEIEDELIKLESFEEEKKRASLQSKAEDKPYWKCFNWDYNIPTKSTIEQNAKKIRKLALKLYRGDRIE